MFSTAINFAQQVTNGSVSPNLIYWVLFIGIAVVSYVVQANLKRKFEKYSKMPVAMTGHDVAVKMLHDNGIYDVKVTSTPGTLTDHYNPVTKTVNLSQGVYNSASVAAVAVAALRLTAATRKTRAQRIIFLACSCWEARWKAATPVRSLWPPPAAII
jgi:Zn-dependent membrane protease YugP